MRRDAVKHTFDADLLIDVRPMNSLTVALLYPPPPGSKTPFARTVLSDPDPTQRHIVDVLGLERSRHS
jgi:hypothetical protein